MSFHRLKVAIALAATGAAVSSCAAIFSGTTQQISVNTNPAGASCKFLRKGAPIAEVSSTPGAATIQKTKDDINVVCSKAGYNDNSYINHSGVAGATYADILGGVVTGGIAWAVDSSSGADNHYDNQVNMTLFPLGTAAPAGSGDVAVAAPAPGQTSSPPATAGAPSSPASSGAQVHSAAAASSVAGNVPFGPGVWMCAINNMGNTANPRFTLQFVVADDKSIVVTSYANAPATVVEHNPLTFTAINPRGSREMKIVWKPDNSMIITGPNLNKPGTFFYNEGSCVKT
jgi:hypothetical protein